MCVPFVSKSLFPIGRGAKAFPQPWKKRFEIALVPRHSSRFRRLRMLWWKRSTGAFFVCPTLHIERVLTFHVAGSCNLCECLGISQCRIPDALALRVQPTAEGVKPLV